MGVELAPDEEHEILERLAPAVTGPFPTPEQETLVALVDRDAREERVDDQGRLVLRQADLERLQVVAEALAKSTLLVRRDLSSGFRPRRSRRSRPRPRARA